MHNILYKYCIYLICQQYMQLKCKSQMIRLGNQCHLDNIYVNKLSHLDTTNM